MLRGSVIMQTLNQAMVPYVRKSCIDMLSNCLGVDRKQAVIEIDNSVDLAGDFAKLRCLSDVIEGQRELVERND